MSVEATSVGFHSDLRCRWAYQTSLWMREVLDRLGVEVNWRFRPYLEARDRVSIDRGQVVGFDDTSVDDGQSG